MVVLNKHEKYIRSTTTTSFSWLTGRVVLVVLVTLEISSSDILETFLIGEEVIGIKDGIETEVVGWICTDPVDKTVTWEP